MCGCVGVGVSVSVSVWVSMDVQQVVYCRDTRTEQVRSTVKVFVTVVGLPLV